MKRVRKIIGIAFTIIMCLAATKPVSAKRMGENVGNQVSQETNNILYTETVDDSGLTVSLTDYAHQHEKEAVLEFELFFQNLPVNPESFTFEIENPTESAQVIELAFEKNGNVYSHELMMEKNSHKTYNILSNDFKCGGKSFKGTPEKVRISYNVYWYIWHSLEFFKVTAGGQCIWTVAEDNYRIIENPYVTAEFTILKPYVLEYKGVSGDWSSIMFQLPGTGTPKIANLASYEGIGYWVDTTIEGKEVYFNKFLHEANTAGENGEYKESEIYYTSDDSVAVYLDEQTGKEFYSSSNKIPANFKGYVQIPFTNFSMPDWVSGERLNNKKLDLKNLIPELGLTFSGDVGDARFIIKDIVLLKDVYEIPPKTQLTYGDVRMFDTMDYTDETANQMWKTNWELASEMFVSTVETECAVGNDDGKALKLVTGETSTLEGATGFTALEYFPDAGSGDISGGKGLTFWLKNENDKPVKFSFEFDIMQGDSRQRWSMKKYAHYMLFNTETGVESIYSYPDGLYIPAGFEGYVRIGFDQMTNPLWETVTGEFTTDNGLVYFVINLNTTSGSSVQFLFDSLGVYTEEVEITTPFHEPQNSFQKMMTGV